MELLILIVHLVAFSYACDQTFTSTSDLSSKNGSFVAPVFLNPQQHVQQCTFAFIGLENERVSVNFEDFDLKGTPPECFHEYLDLFTEVRKPEDKSLIETPFGGRYCGKIPPRLRISLYNSLSFVFHSDRPNITTERFSGTFQFIPEDKYMFGTPIANVQTERSERCSFIIDSNVQKSGEIMSVTYPGTYPKDLHCSYQFTGNPNQRLRIEFRDFDLFYGGAHCPFDSVTIYDGPDNMAEKIGTYCGQMRNLVIFSTHNKLYITFTTLKRTAPAQNRGFFAIYEFSESFVKLDFIQSDAEHIRGTECDQKILSKKESSGTVFSPNYPFPYQTNIVCRYFIYGMQDEQNLERVKLTFDKFNIPVATDHTCDDGYLKVYMKGQEEEHSYEQHDYEFCGRTAPPMVKTPGPRLVLLFKAGSKPGSGFKANFKFETEYLIPIGTPSPDGSCKFTYRSSSRKDGRFNSPRHPSNYPSNTDCYYEFYAMPHEQVQIVFDNFKVRTDNLKQDQSLGAWVAYGRSQCVEDWLEIYQIYQDRTEELVGRYCANSSPGPVVSIQKAAVGLKVYLHTDEKDVYSGFMGRYNFFQEKSAFGDKSECGGNVSGQTNGVIHSPNYPEKYATSSEAASIQCHWFIHVNPGHKVMMYFETFEVEGNPTDRGCPSATLRVWPWKEKDKTPLELCGDSLDQHTEITSQTNLMRVSFYVADKAVGAKGFKAIWSEIKDTSNCQEFRCAHSMICIPLNLRCNGINNCGANDNSDELKCTTESEVNEFMIIGLGMGILSMAFLAAILICHRKRKRKNHTERPMLPSHAHFHTCESIGERFATSSSMDSV